MRFILEFESFIKKRFIYLKKFSLKISDCCDRLDQSGGDLQQRQFVNGVHG